jgi:hypothetical protein
MRIRRGGMIRPCARVREKERVATRRVAEPGCKLRKAFHAIGMLTICFVVGPCFAQSKQTRISLCGSSAKVAEGSHSGVRVSGVYEGGLGNSGNALGTLSDAACPSETAWIEIALEAPTNRRKLNTILDKSGRAYVVFEGEFYGPPVPDPKLPEALRKNSHPGWGHNGAFKTKLVVHAILDVAVAPSTKP